MKKQYYRVLKPSEEPANQLLISARRSQFRKDVFAYRKLSHAIYVLAIRTGISVLNAVRVAENVPAFLDELNTFFMSSKPTYDLSQMLINDPIKSVSSDELYAFARNYIEAMNETGLCYDWGKEHYLWEFIWEMVRNSEYPDLPSRMDSVFLFDNDTAANEFLKKYRDPEYLIANINLLGGTKDSFDMNWFTEVPSNIPLSEVKEYVRNYWEHKKTKSPVMETLFVGSYSWDIKK